MWYIDLFAVDKVCDKLTTNKHTYEELKYNLLNKAKHLAKEETDALYFEGVRLIKEWQDGDGGVIDVLMAPGNKSSWYVDINDVDEF